MATKKSGNGAARTRATHSPVLEFLDRIQGKESVLSLDLEDVALGLGDRRIQASGNIRLSSVILR